MVIVRDFFLMQKNPPNQGVCFIFRKAFCLLPNSAPIRAWVRLPAREPEWDPQHDFLGWSADPAAAKPELKPGDMALFEEDTVLYAVWKAHYRVIEGAGSVWVKGSGKTQRFVADGNVKYISELRVDGAPFEKGVKISSGSTVADISAKAMETLSVRRTYRYICLY